jgi:hypothetical protein
MSGIVFLPVYPELSPATLDGLADAARRAELKHRAVPTEPRTVAV